MQKDFIILSYKVLYNTIIEIYTDIKSINDILNYYKQRYDIENYNESDVGAVVGAVLILEDVCKYMKLKQDKIIDILHESIYKKI